MKKVVLITIVSILFGGIDCFARTDSSRYDHPLEFFIPGTFSDNYDPSIPKPDEVLGYALAEFYPEWYAVLNYIHGFQT